MIPTNNNQNEPGTEQPASAPSRRAVIVLLIVFIVATLIADIFVHQHEHFGFEDLPGAYGLLALVGGGLLLLAVTSFSPIIRRKVNGANRYGARQHD